MRMVLPTSDGPIELVWQHTEHEAQYSVLDLTVPDRRNPSKPYVSGANGGPRPKPKPVRIKRVVRSKRARNR